MSRRAEHVGLNRHDGRWQVQWWSRGVHHWRWFTNKAKAQEFMKTLRPPVLSDTEKANLRWLRLASFESIEARERFQDALGHHHQRGISVAQLAYAVGRTPLAVRSDIQKVNRRARRAAGVDGGQQ